MAMMLPMAASMLSDPNTRKTMGKAVKWLLVLGALGIAVILFIFLGKKFNIKSMVDNLFKKGISTITEPFKQIGTAWETGIKKIGTDWDTGVKKIGTDWEAGVKKAGTAWETGVKKIGTDWDTGVKKMGTDIESKKKEIKNVFTEAARSIDIMIKSSPFLPKPVATRAAVVQTTLKKGADTKAFDVGQIMGNIFQRKTAVIAPKIKIPIKAPIKMPIKMPLKKR